jgi:hypothetical protein
MLKSLLLLLAASFLSITFAKAQKSDKLDLEKHSLWLEGQVGLNFFNNETARFSDNFTQNSSINDYFTGRFSPKINYAICNQLFVGAHLGLGYDSFEQENDGRFEAWNYTIGLQTQYYYTILGSFYAYAEAGINFNYYSIEQGGSSQKNNQNLYKTYVDIGVSYIFDYNWKVSLMLKDVVSFHSARPNFDRRSGWNVNNVFKDFINFPHFSIAYKLN